MTRLNSWFCRIGMIVLTGSAACEGPAGPRGAEGERGDVGAQGERGADGESGPPGMKGDRGPTGEAGQPPSTQVPLAERGLVGSVVDPSGAPVSTGAIVLVPANDVAMLGKQALDLSLSPDAARTLAIDEPLEDLLDRSAGYSQAAVQADGSYRFESVPSGRYFVAFAPAGEDTSHLPGGSACRTAVDSASLIGTRLNIRVSGRPSDRASFVGSTTCFGCHGRQRSTRTAHRVGLQLPAARGPYQDIRPWAAFDAALLAFDSGKTLYFYDCDASRPGDAKCRVSEVDPSLGSPPVPPQFELRLARDMAVPTGSVGTYTAVFTNRAGAGTASYPIALTYGGALGRQQYVTRRGAAADGFSYLVLPVQYNAAGSALATSSDDWPYRDFRSGDWYDFDAHTLRSPDSERSFDVQCAGCHFTGFQLGGSGASGYHASAVSDPNGDFDYDGDGRAEEINTGCESCHGPGSEHVEARVRGQAIISPSLVTPERELLICGRCHSRPQGAFGAGSEAPLSADGKLPLAGLRRADFAAFTSRVDAAAEHLYPSGDSRANHQQYTDFLRSSMSRNGNVLMTCSSCHDPHGDDSHPHELRAAPSDNAACTGCHSEDRYRSVRDHLKLATNESHENSDDSLLTCTNCHMVKTAAAGARHPELLDALPKSAPPVQYEHGDLASHRFAVTRRNRASVQPVAASLSCAFCHTALLDNP